MNLLITILIINEASWLQLLHFKDLLLFSLFISFKTESLWFLDIKTIQWKTNNKQNITTSDLMFSKPSGLVIVFLSLLFLKVTAAFQRQVLSFFLLNSEFSQD